MNPCQEGEGFGLPPTSEVFHNRHSEHQFGQERSGVNCGFLGNGQKSFPQKMMIITHSIGMEWLRRRAANAGARRGQRAERHGGAPRDGARGGLGVPVRERARQLPRAADVRALHAGPVPPRTELVGASWVGSWGGGPLDTGNSPPSQEGIGVRKEGHTEFDNEGGCCRCQPPKS